MTGGFDLQRFIDAQNGIFDQALAELHRGRKESHWMWFIFPQLRGLGRSPTAQYYAIASSGEARAFLADPTLGPRLRRSVEALLSWANTRTAEQILGPIDALKLRSSLTLFDAVAPGETFDRGLAAFFGGQPDERTLALLNERR